MRSPINVVAGGSTVHVGEATSGRVPADGAPVPCEASIAGSVEPLACSWTDCVAGSPLFTEETTRGRESVVEVALALNDESTAGSESRWSAP